MGRHQYGRWVMIGLYISLLSLIIGYLWTLQRRLTILETQADTIRHDFAAELRFELDILRNMSERVAGTAVQGDTEETQLNVVQLQVWLDQSKSTSERYSFYHSEPPLDFALGQMLEVYDNLLNTIQNELSHTSNLTPLQQQQLTLVKDDFAMLSTLFTAEILDRGDSSELNLQLATWCSRIQVDVVRQKLQPLTLCP